MGRAGCERGGLASMGCCQHRFLRLPTIAQPSLLPRALLQMGLGKTAQSISVLAFQRQFGGIRGPFLGEAPLAGGTLGPGLGSTGQKQVLRAAVCQQRARLPRAPAVIAPLTTLGHWQREIETWTDMNCVVYAGSAPDREVIQVGTPGWRCAEAARRPTRRISRVAGGPCCPLACPPTRLGRHGLQEYDLFVEDDRPGRRRGAVKPHVVLASYETVLKDRSLFAVRGTPRLAAPARQDWARCARDVGPCLSHAYTRAPLRQGIAWETVIIDEAHRMKSTGSSTRAAIASMPFQWLLLLTGAPCRAIRQDRRSRLQRMAADPDAPQVHGCLLDSPSRCLLVPPPQAPLCRTTCVSCLVSSTCWTLRPLKVRGAPRRATGRRASAAVVGEKLAGSQSAVPHRFVSGLALPTVPLWPRPASHPDEAEFLRLYGDERAGMTPDQVKALQLALRPILLRRMKEDVETLPEKEEVGRQRMHCGIGGVSPDWQAFGEPGVSG